MSCLTCQSHPQAYKEKLIIQDCAYLLFLLTWRMLLCCDPSASGQGYLFLHEKVVNSISLKQAKREVSPCLCGSQRDVCRLFKVQVCFLSLAANVSCDNRGNLRFHPSKFPQQFWHVAQTMFCLGYLAIKDHKIRW